MQSKQLALNFHLAYQSVFNGGKFVRVQKLVHKSLSLAMRLKTFNPIGQPNGKAGPAFITQNGSGTLMTSIYKDNA